MMMPLPSRDLTVGSGNAGTLTGVTGASAVNAGVEITVVRGDTDVGAL